MNKFFMIVGAPKCGTTSLSNWLRQHPDICMANPNEPRFFEWEYPYGLDWYFDKYYSSQEYYDKKFIGEARTRNLLIPYVPERIERTMGSDTKIIICTRDPVSRFFSEWKHWRSMRPGREILSAAEAFELNKSTFDLDYFDSEERWSSQLDPMGGPYRRMYLEAGYPRYYGMKYYMPRFEVLYVDLSSIAGESQIAYNRVLNFLGAEPHKPVFNHMRKGVNYAFELSLVADVRDFYDNHSI